MEVAVVPLDCHSSPGSFANTLDAWCVCWCFYLPPGAGAMKYFSSIFLCFSCILPHVHSLSLTVQPGTPSGTKTVVVWAREPTDPNPLSFDLRFVNASSADVGLAMANIYPTFGENFGTLPVTFPSSGKYMLIAVTGSPRYRWIGQSNEIEIPTRTSQSSSIIVDSTQSSSASTPSYTHTNGTAYAQPVSVTGKRDVNVSAIAGGIVGALLFLCLITAAIIYFQRKQRARAMRISFHKDMMVQRHSPDDPGPSTSRSKTQKGLNFISYPFLNSPAKSSKTPSAPATRQLPIDVEHGLSITIPPPVFTRPSDADSFMGSPLLGTGHTVPPPRGPRGRSNKYIVCKRGRDLAERSSISEDSESGRLTPRQQLVADRMSQVERQIDELESQSHRGPSSNVLLYDLHRQLSWLEKQKSFTWARGKTDILPPGYNRYMAS